MHGCTITTSHYLAHARVMAESFLAHNPGAGFSVLVIEDAPHMRPGGGSFQTHPAGGSVRGHAAAESVRGHAAAESVRGHAAAESVRGHAAAESVRTHADAEPFETLAPADIGIDAQELNRRATMYLTQGLAVSMKPNLLLALLDRGHETVLFLDSDSCVYADLAGLEELAREHSLVLSPHSLDPYPLWRVDSPEQTFIRAGTMNAGLLGVAAAARPFLEWWAQRTARRCVFDVQHGLFLEQTWLMLAPALFEHHVLRDRGCNVAGWNLHTRDVQWQGDEPLIDGGPLRHFHFAMSYDPESPQRLTASEHAQWWPSLEERPGVARLSREYAQRLIAHGYREAKASPPLFDAMPGGAPIEPWMRASYYAALLDAEEDGTEEPPNPFSHGQEHFLQWLEPRAVERLSGRSPEAGLRTAPEAGPATVPESGPAAVSGAGPAAVPGAGPAAVSGAGPAAVSGAGPASSSGAASRERPSEGLVGGDPFSAQELAKAMLDTEKLLVRIRELESIRDDAIGWAERVTAELDRAEGTIAERNSSIREIEGRREQLAVELDHLRNVIEDIVQSPSWRVTKPLRSAKAIVSRTPRAR